MSRVLLLLAVVLTAAALAIGVRLAGPDGGFEARTLAPQPPGATVAEVRGAPAPSLEASAAGAPSVPAQIEPVEILRRWDARRARAWARGDPALLRHLYVPGSLAGRRDRAMLRAWTGRGLVVERLHTQLLSVRQLGHTPGSWTLAVTDRVAGGVAVGPGLRRPLPRDLATSHTVVLRRVDGAWRVASVRSGEVRPQDS